MTLRGGELSVCYEAVAPFYNMIAVQHPIYISSNPPADVGDPLADQTRDRSSCEGHAATAGAESTVEEESFKEQVPTGRDKTKLLKTASSEPCGCCEGADAEDLRANRAAAGTG